MPTTNPVPSTDPGDLLYNAQKLDEVVSGSADTYTDRLGVSRLTLSGAMRRLGYEPTVAFSAGLLVERSTQTVTVDGLTYHANPSFIPFTTSSTFDPAKWVLIYNVRRDEVVLRDRLAGSGAGDGGNMVSLPSAGTPAPGSVAQRLAGLTNDGEGRLRGSGFDAPQMAVRYPDIDGGNCTLAGLDGHGTWLRFQPSQDESPIEVLVYPSAAQGRATATAGGNTITRVSGTPFKASWVGRKFYLGENVYKIASVPSTNSLTVTTVGGGAVSFSSTYTETFHVFVVQGSGVCNVTGTTVTRVSGDKFIPFIGTMTFKVAGTARTVSGFVDANTLTLSAAPGNATAVAYTYECDINDQIAAFRVQKMLGSDEENVSLYARYDGYWLHTLYAGQGQYRKLILGSGEISAGTLARQIVMQPNGDLCIGGDYDYEAVRVLNQAGSVNRLETIGATAGLAPTWRARGSDANVGMGFDTKGSGNFTFTSNSFGKTEFEIFGDGGDDWMAVGSETGKAVLSGRGASANVDIALVPKGSGAVWLGAHATGALTPTGYITVKDSAGALRRLLVG